MVLWPALHLIHGSQAEYEWTVPRGNRLVLQRCYADACDFQMNVHAEWSADRQHTYGRCGSGLTAGQSELFRKQKSQASVAESEIGPKPPAGLIAALPNPRGIYNFMDFGGKHDGLEDLDRYLFVWEMLLSGNWRTRGEPHLPLSRLSASVRRSGIAGPGDAKKWLFRPWAYPVLYQYRGQRQSDSAQLLY